MSAITKLPRGIRNNNPLNIRQTTPSQGWRGETGDDGEFVIYSDPKFGYRAAFKILKSYARRDVVTLSAIVARWAPKKENDTKAYIDFVSKRTGFHKKKNIRTRMEKMKLIEAMAYFENGRKAHAFRILEQGYDLAA